jgi:hypothetical protein
MYSSILTEKKKTSNLKIEIVQKLSNMYGKLFNPIINQATKAITRAIKIQLVFDIIMVVGIASIIALMLKILKNQNVQTESLVLTEAISFNSIVGFIASFVGSAIGFLLLTAGLLYNIAFFKGYFKGDSDTTIVGFTYIVGLLKDMLFDTIKQHPVISVSSPDNTSIEKRAKQLDTMKENLTRLENIYTSIIRTTTETKAKYDSLNAFIRFFKVYGIVFKSVGLKNWFDIVATPIVLASMSLRIELPEVFERVKSTIRKRLFLPEDLIIKKVDTITLKDIKQWCTNPTFKNLLKYNNYLATIQANKFDDRYLQSKLPRGKVGVAITVVATGLRSHKIDELSRNIQRVLFIGNSMDKDLKKLLNISSDRYDSYIRIPKEWLE